MVSDTRSTVACKMVQKMSAVDLSKRCLRSHNATTVHVSKVNKKGDQECTPVSRKQNGRARSQVPVHVSKENKMENTKYTSSGSGEMNKRAHLQGSVLASKENKIEDSKYTPSGSGKMNKKARLPGSVLASKENKMEDPKYTPKSGSRKMDRRAHPKSTPASEKVNSRPHSQEPCCSDSGLNSQILVESAARVLGEMQNSRKITNVGKRPTRTALKIYDYNETDPDSENRPEGMSKKKSQTEVMAAAKIERVSDSKRKRSGQTNLTMPSKRNSIINSSYFLCGEKIGQGTKRQNNIPEVLHTEPKLKKKSVLTDVSGTTKLSVKAKCTETITKSAERKCSSVNDSGVSSTKLASNDLTNSKNLNDLRGQSCSTPVISRMPATSLGISPIVAEAVVKTRMPSISTDKICEDVSDAFINVSTVSKQQGEVDCTIDETEDEDELNEEDAEDHHHEPLHLGLTSTPEKNPSSAVPCKYSSFADSGMDNVVEVTLYDSPKKLSPIKTVDPPDSSLSDDSCYWDDEFESPLQAADDDGTPIKKDVKEKVMKSFRAYHTPHQFRRHLFKTKSKKTSQKSKFRSRAEVKLDLWASVMNDHFEDIEDSELVIE